MGEHPIENLMLTAMSSIQDMVDVNTIIGEPIITDTKVTIIPISKVCFGFAAGGSEFNGETMKEYNKKNDDEEIEYKLPFGGGAGAGVSIHPEAFLVVQDKNVKLIPVNHDSYVDRLLDYVPDLIQKVNEMFDKTNCLKENKNSKFSNTTESKTSYSGTNKQKSEEVKVQEKKVAQNEKNAGYQEVSDCLQADGEIFGEE